MKQWGARARGMFGFRKWKQGGSDPQGQVLGVDRPDCFGREARTYNQDGLITMHGVSFASESRFRDAYLAARATDSWFGGELHWRMHVLTWAASTALKVEGAFVECGTNRGGSALMLLKYLGDALAVRPFYLFDTFCGLEPSLSLRHEYAHYSNQYPECYEQVLARFRPYPKVQLVRGPVPATLPGAGVGQVAFLHIDLNAAAPERAAFEYFWPRMAAGGVIVFDDYNWVLCQSQKHAIDDYARAIGRQVLSLPTGQGLLVNN